MPKQPRTRPAPDWLNETPEAEYYLLADDCNAVGSTWVQSVPLNYAEFHQLKNHLAYLRGIAVPREDMRKKLTVIRGGNLEVAHA